VEKQIAKYKSLYGEPRLNSVRQVIDDIDRRHQLALSKVKIVHPPTPKITLVYEPPNS
jgi:hypothetical protein